MLPVTTSYSIAYQPILISIFTFPIVLQHWLKPLQTRMDNHDKDFVFPLNFANFHIILLLQCGDMEVNPVPLTTG